MDVADKLQFRWSKDGREFYVGKSVTVNATDVDTKAVYSFEAMENGIKRGYYEVTITDVMDGEDGKDGETGVRKVRKDRKGQLAQRGRKEQLENGIKSITNYYLATASGSGVSASTSGWTTTVQAITASKKYLWNYEVCYLYKW